MSTPAVYIPQHRLQEPIVNALRHAAGQYTELALINRRSGVGAVNDNLTRAKEANNLADLITQYGLAEIVNLELQT
jgi:hypothetical protein